VSVARAAKKKATTKSASGGGFSIFDDSDPVADADSDEELPKDEAGRQKIKQQYVDLLGIRIQKLRGRILNRERINKTLEGIYFICARCNKVCQNLDVGLVVEDENANNICSPCSQTAAQPVHATLAPKDAVRKKKIPTAAKAPKPPRRKK
jgi:hypothetical protein